MAGTFPCCYGNRVQELTNECPVLTHADLFLTILLREARKELKGDGCFFLASSFLLFSSIPLAYDTPSLHDLMSTRHNNVNININAH